MALYSVDDCHLITFDKHHSDNKGNLSVAENDGNSPFHIKRAYWLYDVPGGESRGAHAHKELEQIIIAASGSFSITLDDGQNKKTFFLNRPYIGLHVRPGIWGDLFDFSSGAVCLVLSSENYSSADYLRDYGEFLNFRKL